MELSMLTIEAFAHYMRGAVTLFFIIWCFKLYVYKRRNRMMKLLYFISTNYSYRENIDVSWVVISCIAYFSTLFFFTFAFDQTTWLSESMYNLSKEIM